MHVCIGCWYVIVHYCVCGCLGLFVCSLIGVRVQGFAGVSSMSPPGGNQVDGLLLAPVRNQLWASWHLANERTFLLMEAIQIQICHIQASSSENLSLFRPSRLCLLMCFCSHVFWICCNIFKNRKVQNDRGKLFKSFGRKSGWRFTARASQNGTSWNSANEETFRSTKAICFETVTSQNTNNKSVFFFRSVPYVY